jgi:hypothetical protein
VTIGFGAVGTKASGGSTINTGYPASVGAGDLLLACRNAYDLVTTVCSDEAGWTPSGDLYGGANNGATDDHGSRVRVDYREAAGGETGSVVFDQTGAVNGGICCMARYTKTAASWDTVQSTTGDDATHGANRSVTASGTLDLAPGDMVVAVVAVDTDSALTVTSPAITASGITFGTTNRRASAGGTTTGRDGNVEVFDAVVTSGSGTVAPSLAFTTATSQCGPAAFIRLREAGGLTAVGKDLAAVWDTRAAVGDPLQLVWNTRAAIADTVQAAWDARAAVADSVQLVWNTRAALGDPVDLRWDVRAATADDLQLVWDVQTLSTAVGKDLGLLWSLKANIGDPLQLVWGVRTPVADTLQLAWDARGALGDPLALVWDVRSALGDPLQLIWNTWAAVGDPLQLVWSTWVPIGDSVQLTWDTRTALSDPLQLTWNARAATSTAIDLRWDVRKTAGDTLQAIWDVQAIGVAAIGKNVSLQWSLKAPLGRDVGIQWDARATSAVVLALLWEARSSTAKVGQYLWSVRSKAGDDLALVWTVASLADLAAPETPVVSTIESGGTTMTESSSFASVLASSIASGIEPNVLVSAVRP